MFCCEKVIETVMFTLCKTLVVRFSVHKYEGYFVDFVFVLVFFALPFFLNFLVPFCRNCFTRLVMVFCIILFFD